MRYPKLCRHKRSGIAYATHPTTGKQVSFQHQYGTREAQAAYDRWIAELAARRQDVAGGAPPGTAVLLSELLADYVSWAKKYYVKGGKPTTEVKLIARVVKETTTLFPDLAAAAFGPSQLKAVRQAFIAADWNLASINAQVAKLVRAFRWGVENELVKPEHLVSLRAVKALAPGRCPARPPQPVPAVDAAHVRAAAAKAREPYATMFLVHLATGMRTGELLAMEGGRIDRSAAPWIYSPRHHKTDHRGKTKLVYIGPEARALLAPLLLKHGGGPLWIGYRHRPVSPSAYTDEIKRACGLAGVPYFRPLQIRHRFLTDARRAAGIEGAQALAGHSNLSTTEIYAEKRHDLAASVIEKIG